MLSQRFWHLKYSIPVHFTLLSSSLHFGICSISVLCILFCFPYPYILASAIFAFCISEFSFLVSAYWQLQYPSSINLTLLALVLHISICSIWPLYISLCFPPLCIFLSALFHFSIFYCASLVSAYWHLQYFSSVYLTLPSSFIHIDIFSISVLYISLWFPYLCILTSAVF